MADLILRATYEARPDLDDLVESVVFLSRCTGSSIEDLGSETRVSLYFDSESDRHEARKQLGSRAAIELEDLDASEIDWIERYEQSLEAMRIGRRWIVAAREDLVTDNDRDRTPLIIPQERAFGTGSHETTALCLELMERIDLDRASCIDVGTGSGILSVAALKAGAESVVAFDVDTDAAGPLGRNASRNGISIDRFRVFIGTLDAISSRARFDVAFMNILPHVVVPALPIVRELLAEGGSLIVSGVIEAEIDNVREAASHASFSVRSEARRGEWWAALLHAE